MSENLNPSSSSSETFSKNVLMGRILFWVFVLLIIGAIGATYWRIMIKKDYIISAQTDCDPYSEACFVWECDPESTVEGEACTGEPEKDAWYYKIINRNAANIPICDPNEETCQALVCPEGEAECEEVLCDEATKEEQGVECNDPVKYLEENPVEEELEEEIGGEETEPAEEEEEGEVSAENPDAEAGALTPSE